MTETVSILMPFCNREKFVSQAVESILGQSYTDIVLITYNDGSTDSSLQILNNYVKKDVRIKLISGEKNLGVGYARNMLLRECKTQYACWQDSDDVSNKYRVEIMLAYLKKYGPEYLLYSRLIKFHNVVEWRNKPVTAERHTGFATIFFQTNELVDFREDIKFGGEDRNWVSRLKQSGRKYEVMPEVLYYVRGHQDRIGGWKKIVPRLCSIEERLNLSPMELIKLCKERK